MAAITIFSSQRMEHLYYSSIPLFGNGRFLIKVLILSSYLGMVVTHRGGVNITVPLHGNGRFFHIPVIYKMRAHALLYSHARL